MPKDFGVASAVGDRVLTYTELAKVWIGIERSGATTSNKLLLWVARISEQRLAVKTWRMECVRFQHQIAKWVIPFAG